MISLDQLFHLPGLKGKTPQDVFPSIPYLCELTPHQFHVLKGQLLLREYRKGEVVFQENAYDSSLYLLLVGRVILKDAKGKILAKLTPGSLFGVSAAIAGSPHSATAEATQESLILEVPFQAILQWKKMQPKFKEDLDRIYIQRALIQQLKRVPLFSGLSEEEFETLKSLVRLTEYPKGSIIVKQGLEADTFYIIRQGIVVVQKTVGEKTLTLAYLKGGQFFGEMGLVEERVRQASVTAKTDVACVEIDKSTFQQLYRDNPHFQKTIDAIIKEREKEPLPLAWEPLVAEGLFIAKVALAINLKKCIFCNQCVEACKAYYGVPRIQLQGKVVRSYLFPHACYHCDDPVCMLCPIGAIRRGEKGEVYILPYCNGCGYCIDACPFGVIQMVDNLAHKCDLCRGLKRQACQHHCPTRAISITSPENLFR